MFTFLPTVAPDQMQLYEDSLAPDDMFSRYDACVLQWWRFTNEASPESLILQLPTSTDKAPTSTAPHSSIVTLESYTQCLNLVCAYLSRPYSPHGVMHRRHSSDNVARSPFRLRHRPAQSPSLQSQDRSYPLKCLDLLTTIDCSQQAHHTERRWLSRTLEPTMMGTI